MKEQEYSHTSIILSILFIIILFYISIMVIKSIEGGLDERDWWYKALCGINELEIYKESDTSPHIKGCYEIDERAIIHYYYLETFEGKYTLREGLK